MPTENLSPSMHMCLLALAKVHAERPGETSTARMLASRKLVARGYAERVEGKKGLRITAAGLAYCATSPGELLPRRYIFKLYPTRAQAEALDAMRRLHCDLWNALLQQREEAYSRQGKSLTAFDQMGDLKPLRAAFPEYAALSSDSMAVTVQRLDRAFSAFFKRAKEGAGAAAGYPRFTPWRLYPGFGFRKHRSGWAMTLEQGRSAGRLYVKGCPGTIKLRGRLPAEPMAEHRSCDLTWRDGAWWLSVVTVMAPRRSAASGAIIVDLDVDRGEIRVTRPNGARGPAPFAACDGRNHQPNQADVGASPAEAGDLGGDRGQHVEPVGADPAEAGDLGGDRGIPTHPARLKTPAEAGDSGGDRGAGFSGGERCCPAEAGDSINRDCISGGCPSALSGSAGQQKGSPDQRDAAGSAADTGDLGANGRWCVVQPASAKAADGGDLHLGSAADDADAARIVELQQGMARCKKGSVKYRKRREAKARIEARMRRRRSERMHVITSDLARRADDVTLVTLAAPKDTTKTAKGSEKAPGAAVDIRAEINRRILSQAPAAFRAALEYKVAEAGGRLVVEERESLLARAGEVVGGVVMEARHLRAKSRKELKNVA